MERGAVKTGSVGRASSSQLHRRCVVVGKKYRVVTYSGNIYDVEVIDKGDYVSLKLIGSDDELSLRVKKIDDENYIVYLGSESYRINLSSESIYIDNEPMLISKIIELLPIGLEASVSKSGEKPRVSVKGEIRAPLSGKITEIKVKKGERVRSGDVVALMVSMKMVVEIKSDVDGVVEEIYVSPGKAVTTGDLLLKISVEEKKRKKK